jgi:hypothetical protein
MKDATAVASNGINYYCIAMIVGGIVLQKALKQL